MLVWAPSTGLSLCEPSAMLIHHVTFNNIFLTFNPWYSGDPERLCCVESVSREARSNEDFVCLKGTRAFNIFSSEVFLYNPSSLISNPHHVSLRVPLLASPTFFVSFLKWVSMEEASGGKVQKHSGEWVIVTTAKTKEWLLSFLWDDRIDWWFWIG